MHTDTPHAFNPVTLVDIHTHFFFNFLFFLLFFCYFFFFVFLFWFFFSFFFFFFNMYNYIYNLCIGFFWSVASNFLNNVKNPTQVLSVAGSIISQPIA